MKTPEEIKIALACCSRDECKWESHECPYIDESSCTTIIARNALAYINELEARTCLNTLRDAIFEDAVAHGLWERTDRYVRESIEENMRDNVPVDQEAMMRIWAMEIIRDEIYELHDSIGNAEAYTDELADVIIASLSVAGKLGIDIDAAVRRKMDEGEDDENA